jgi:hypothetical protein
MYSENLEHISLEFGAAAMDIDMGCIFRLGLT